MLYSVVSSFEVIALSQSLFYLSCDCQCYVSLPLGAWRLPVIVAFLIILTLCVWGFIRFEYVNLARVYPLLLKCVFLSVNGCL